MNRFTPYPGYPCTPSHATSSYPYGKFQKVSSYPVARYQSGGLLSRITAPRSNDKIVVYRLPDSLSAVASVGAESVPVIDAVSVIGAATQSQAENSTELAVIGTVTQSQAENSTELANVANVSNVSNVSNVANVAIELRVSDEPVEFTGKHGPFIKKLTEDILNCTLQLKSIKGLCFVDSGNPPHIPAMYLSREDYAHKFDKLTDEVETAVKAYTVLVGVDPTECAQYAEFMFGRHPKTCASPDIIKSAEDVKKARMNIRYFLDNRVAVDLNALRSKVLNLHEVITQSKHNLRALQFDGVEIGTSIFPDSFKCVDPDGVDYSPVHGWSTVEKKIKKSRLCYVSFLCYVSWYIFFLCV